jgi:hypothetical protein
LQPKSDRIYTVYTRLGHGLALRVYGGHTKLYLGIGSYGVAVEAAGALQATKVVVDLLKLGIDEGSRHVVAGAYSLVGVDDVKYHRQGHHRAATFAFAKCIGVKLEPLLKLFVGAKLGVLVAEGIVVLY